jgi:muramidase (phage lysozyme)/uncharacterized protein (UPF0147 family)
MAIKSALRPESIVRRNPINSQSAQNFISGGAPLGSSVVSSAANKIVGFQRAAVKPVTPDINSIVSTISSNILNQVDNSIRNATNITNRQVDGKLQQVASNTINQIQQIRQQQNSQVTQLQTVVQNIRQQTANFTKQLSDNYQKRLRDVDAAKPVGILDKFLDAYKNALGFVNFFGSGKNIKQLRESLATLKTSFTESFEIAKLIRQTILKIVNQLSNLPQASPGGSPGLNLDIDVPGGPLRRTTPRSARIGRRGAGLLGLGLGAVGGGMAVNALADSDRLQSIPQISNIPTGLVDTFAFIVNKFANAVEEMIKGSSAKTGQGPSTSSPGGGTPAAKPSSTPASPGGGAAADVTADTQEEKAWLQTIRAAEGTSGKDGYGKIFGGEVVPELAQGKLTIEEAAKLAETGKLPQRLGGKVVNYGAYKGQISGATGAYQFMPSSLRSAAKLAGIDLNQPMTPEVQDKLALSWLRSGGVDPTKRATEAMIRKAGQPWGWAGLHGEATGQTKQTVKQSLEMYNKFYGTQAKPDKGMGGLGVDPSMFAPEERAKLAMSISQPPPSQAKPSVVTLPGITGGQQQSSGGGGGGQVIIPPTNPLGDSGPSIPILPSSDSANFLTMYSKIVYNIVDG